MIYTCTLNPAIDYQIRLDDLHRGKLNRSSFSQFQTGGKAINVSIVLNELKTPNIATGFLGGFTGEYLEKTLNEQYHLQTKFIHVDDFTRVNIKLNVSGEETEINQAGPKITPSDFHQLLHLIDSMSKNDIFIASGSAVKGVDQIYLELAKACKNNGIPFIVDATKSDLSDVLPYQPLLVKPNLHELEEFFQTSIKNHAEIIQYAQKLLALGAKNVIVSLGGKGSVFVSQDTVMSSKAIVGEVKSTVGAGDSMVAGFVSRYSKDQNLFESYKCAIACASATAFSPGLATLTEIEALLPEVKIEVK